jgi:hypothetical protein
MFQTKVVEKIKTQFYVVKAFSEKRAVYAIMWRNIAEPGTSVLYAGYFRLPTHIQNM